MRFLILFCVVIISACGMQGDLYLPEAKTSQGDSVHDSAGKSDSE